MTFVWTRLLKNRDTSDLQGAKEWLCRRTPLAKKRKTYSEIARTLSHERMGSKDNSSS